MNTNKNCWNSLGETKNNGQCREKQWKEKHWAAQGMHRIIGRLCHFRRHAPMTNDDWWKLISVLDIPLLLHSLLDSKVPFIIFYYLRKSMTHSFSFCRKYPWTLCTPNITVFRKIQSRIYPKLNRKYILKVVFNHFKWASSYLLVR